MQCHKVDYTLIGDVMQAVEIGLNPGETVIADAGNMNYMNDAIRFETRMGDGTPAPEGLLGSLVAAGRRLFTGENLFLTHFTNTAGSKRHVTFSAPCPGRVIALDMAALGQEIFCQKDAFLCAARGTQVSIAFTRRMGAGFFGRDGFVLMRLVGDGMAFVHAGGMMVEKTLKNETLCVDTGCIVAFTSGIHYSAQQADNLKSMFFGGENLFLATLSGTGTVFLQTLPLSRPADRILRQLASFTGKRKAETAD